MKKFISILLTLCMLLPFGAQALAANTYTPEELEQLKQSAEGGNVDAMVTLGNLYYKGSYNAGISRDFGRALEWFEMAANAGNKDVMMNVASIYEVGSAGNRSLEKAYDWYKKAMEAGISGAKEKTEEPQFAAFHWKDSVEQLTGRLGDWESPLYGRSVLPFYLDRPVENCSVISMDLSIVEYTGWPFGLYALFAKGLDGQWTQLDYVNIEKSQENGESRTYQFNFDTPISFEALAIALIEEGMQFNLTLDQKFYVDKTNITAYSDAVPAPEFTAVEAEFPMLSSYVATSAYVNPYPAG